MTGEYRKRILVVEDEAKLARLLKDQLESAGYAVHTEAHGTTALRYAAEHRLDLVILDLRLPDIHGYQVCRELRKLCQPWVVPVLMLTAMDRPIDRLRGFAHGGDAYLPKPFHFSELLETMALLIGETAPA